MKMAGEERISAPIQAVWAALNDPEILRQAIPGCQSLVPIGDDAFEAAATIKVGPISARFGGKVRLYDLDPPNGYKISGEGSGGAAGAAKGGAQVRLVEDGADTILHYEASAEVSGRLAQLGGKLIDLTAKQLAGVFFSRFAQEVVKGASPASTPVAMAADPAQPAAAVAKHISLPQEAIREGGIATNVCLVISLAALATGMLIGGLVANSSGLERLAFIVAVLLGVVVAASAFTVGRRSGRSRATVRLDDESIARLADAVGRQR